jgi:hypothetical protein
MFRVVLPAIANAPAACGQLRWAISQVSAAVTTEIATIAPTDAVAPPSNIVSISATNIRITIEAIVAVNVNVVAAPAAAPTPPAAPEGPHRDANPEGDCHSRGVVPDWRIVNRRIGIDGGTVHYDRIVRRHINHLRVRLLDNDRTFAFNNLRFHLLLFRRTQVALLLSFLAHALDSLHDIRLLSQERVAKIGGPLNVIGQAVYHIGQGRQRLDTGIPRLFRHGISEFLVFEPFVFPEPLLKLDNFEGVCRCSQYLGQQWIRVESNRRHE